MKRIKTIKFPNIEEAYDVYDDEAVRSINGNKPDENGNVADVALKSDIERLAEEKIDKGSPIAHQQLVTDIEGNTVWEEKLAYDAPCFEWDGNEEGRETYKGAHADYYVFISDVVPSITEINQRCVLATNKKGTEIVKTITESDIMIIQEFGGMTIVGLQVFILTEEAINAIKEAQMQFYYYENNELKEISLDKYISADTVYIEISDENYGINNLD